jgi:RHS repeat-associated protein
MAVLNLKIAPRRSPVTPILSGRESVLTATRQWDFGFRLRSIANAVSGATVTSHNHAYDSLNRRTKATLEDGSAWNYGYNNRNELTGAGRNWSDWTPVSGQQFGYGYDNIGNRTTAASGGDTHGGNLRSVSYTVNNLNEYTAIATPGYKDIVGLALATNTVTVNSGVADRKGEYFHRELPISNTGGAIWTNVAITAGGTTNGGLAHPASSQTLVYDADGNLTFDGIWKYSWDAENRLTSMNMTNIIGVSPTNRLKLDFAYDFMNRRISKIVSTNSTGNNFIAQSTNYYIYDGWNLIASFSPGGAIQQSFVWGLDLSGTMTKAGGIGGLAVAYIGGTNNFVGYDGNGNVTSLISAADKTTTARYEYSPFGEVIRATGPAARQNEFRFSTKFRDDETGIIFYGLRYYTSSQGRWIGRDPSEESGGDNLFNFVGNTPGNVVDSDGQTGLPLASLFELAEHNTPGVTKELRVMESSLRVREESTEAMWKATQAGSSEMGERFGLGALGGFEVAHKALDAFKNGEAATALVTDFAADFKDYYKDVGTPWQDLDAISIAVDVNKFTLGDLPAAYTTLDILLRP